MKERIKNRFFVMLAAVIAALAFVVPCFFGTAYVASAADDGAQLRVHFGYVGQGDCAIIEFPNGKTMIIDGSDYKDENKTLVMNFVSDTLPSDFKYFDYAILTHADADHCGSLDDVLNAYPARVVYRPNVKSTYSGFTDPGAAELLPYNGTASSKVYKDFLESAYRVNADFTPEVRVINAADAQNDLKIGDGADACDFTFYSPLYTENKKYSSANDYSPIMLLEYRGIKFMMSGDAEEKNEKEFAARVEAAKTDGVTDKYDKFTDAFCADVVKLGHHGSSTSSSLAYLDAVTTESGRSSVYYVVSCGIDNKYKHPSASTLTTLDGLGVPEANILRTDTMGDIRLTVRADESGSYSLYYGENPTQKPQPAPDPEPEEKLPDYFKWILIAAAVIIIIIVIISVSANKGKKSKRGGRR